MVRELWSVQECLQTDGWSDRRTDGQRHAIIRPFFFQNGRIKMILNLFKGIQLNCVNNLRKAIEAVWVLAPNKYSF